MFKFIFLLLKQRLNTLAQLHEIDWFNNQYELSEEEEVIYSCPAAYIEFLPVADLTSQPRKLQKGSVRFRVHLVTEIYRDDDTSFHSAALEHYDFVNLVYKKLLGHSAKLSDHPDFAALANTKKDQQVYNSITRTGISPDHNRKPLMLTIQEFSMTAYDFSAQKTYTKPDPTPKIDATLTTPTL